ncbi:MAG: site-2 protease family protein [Armatimonadetes bacterium]|nr:site-2 protease family protein [Armatimonadota bacterium]
MLMNLLAGIVLVLMFCILVSVHELGHYLAARFFNMGVSEFSIGMGRPILKTFGRRRYKTDDGEEQETLFNVRAWPIGGFVKIVGMEPDDDGNEVQTSGGFYTKGPWQRIVVLLAGPIFSLLFGWVVLVALYTTNGDLVPSNKVSEVVKGEPAAAAGLKVDDRVLSINGHKVESKLDAIYRIRQFDGTRPLDFEVSRDKSVLHIPITPKLSDEESPSLDQDGLLTGDTKKQYLVGVNFGVDRVNVGLIGAMKQAAELPIQQVSMMVKKFTQPKVLVNNSTGVVGMAVITKEAVQSGFSTVFEITGLISISLGIFNLLPIGPLDGGQIFLALIEVVRRGKRISMQAQMKFFLAGLALIISLFLFRNYKDLVQYVIPGKENLIVGTGKKPTTTADNDAPNTPATNTPDATNK